MMNRLVSSTLRVASCMCVFGGLCVLGGAPAHALDGGTVRITTDNGWKAFEVISSGEDPAGDGFSYAMPGTFDGAGAWLVDPATLRVQVNHETSDASISEVDLDVGNLGVAVANVISTGNTGGVSFVISARQAYARWSSDGGSNFVNTSSASNTSFTRFCSGQAYAPDTFGVGRGFVDQLYITGEETAGGRLFALDSVGRDLYQLSGVTGSAPGGIGGMPFDSWENAALLDTGETQHVALLLSPDGGTSNMALYVGEKGKDSNGSVSSSFLARNGLAFGSWYYLNASLPSLGNSNVGSFDTTASGALNATKLEDIDTSPSDPTRAVLGNQNFGVFTFDFALVFSSGFDAGLSSFAVTKISDTSGGTGSLDSPDNVDWTAATTLGGNSYPEGLIFVNEDNGDGEIWRMKPDGSAKLRVGSTTVGAESTGIFDVSQWVGYAPGSVLITNNQGSPASMTVLIGPDATTSAVCGDAVCDVGESPLSCPQDCPDVCGDGVCSGIENPLNCGQDCPDVCGDGLCSGVEATTTCPADCGSACGDGVCNGSEDEQTCPADCAVQCIPDGSGLGCNGTTQCCSGVGNCTGGKPTDRVCAPVASVCGDGVVEGSEQCEAGVALADTCVSLGFDSGTLACNVSTCAYDTSACVGGSCAGNQQACVVNADCCSNNCKNGACKGN